MAIATNWSVPGGKECCCGCCLYPWPDPNGGAGGPFYPFDDLPDFMDITYEGVLYPDSPKTDFGGIGLWGYTNPAYLTGTEPLLSAGDNGAWAYGDDQGGGSQPCLIGVVDAETFSEDQFADTLTVAFTYKEENFPPESTFIPVNRFETTLDPCTWIQPGIALQEGDLTVRIDYRQDVYKYLLTFTYISTVLGAQPFKIIQYTHNDPQNTPVGTYSDKTILGGTNPFDITNTSINVT